MHHFFTFCVLSVMHRLQLFPSVECQWWSCVYLCWSLRSCPVSRVDVGVSSAVLVSCQDEAWSADPPRRHRSPLPPIRTVSDFRLQQSPLCERRQQVSHPGKAPQGFHSPYRRTFTEGVGFLMLDLHNVWTTNDSAFPFLNIAAPKSNQTQLKKPTQTPLIKCLLSYFTFGLEWM